VPKELAASCGIMLWLVTFVAVIPLGLLLAHHERLSLRKLSQESHQEEADAAVPVSPLQSERTGTRHHRSAPWQSRPYF